MRHSDNNNDSILNGDTRCDTVQFDNCHEYSHMQNQATNPSNILILSLKLSIDGDTFSSKGDVFQYTTAL